jgi:hypothetical protein
MTTDESTAPGTRTDLRERIEAPHLRRMWGQQRMVQPRLVDAVFGDGGLLVGIEPVNSRPQYYVVRVDSTLALGLGSDEFRDLLDLQIYESIAEQFGKVDDEDADDADGEPWPALDLTYGCSWFKYELPEPADGAR